MEYTNQRTAYGNTLVEMGGDNQNIVVLDADLGGSTMGKLFEQAYALTIAAVSEAFMLSTRAGVEPARVLRIRRNQKRHCVSHQIHGGGMGEI